MQLVISVVHVGNKQNTNSGKREKKLPAGVAKEASTWEDLLMHEFGMVTSDLGCSFHGMHGSGALNENDMIGYLAKGDGLKLINWPDKAVTIDKYGVSECLHRGNARRARAVPGQARLHRVESLLLLADSADRLNSTRS